MSSSTEPQSKDAHPQRKVFDLAERSQIRDSLFSYMSTHNIGVPTLLNRIAEANDRQPSAISQSTLQRFLKEAHRTNDAFVTLCTTFLSRAPESDPLDSFGQSLAKFLAPETTILTYPRIPDDLSGLFNSFTEPNPHYTKSRDIQSHDFVPYSNLVLETDSRHNYIPVTEQIFNWERYSTFKISPDAKRRIYHGAAVITGASLFFILKNTLAGTPRTYWLTPNNNYKTMMGHAAEPRPSISRPVSYATPKQPMTIEFRRSE